MFPKLIFRLGLDILHICEIFGSGACMAKNIVEKIISEHLLSGEMVAGQEIGIKIDQTLTQDATGTMAYLEFETLRIPKVRTELSVSYVDHNTLQVGFENADDHAYLQTVAAKYGVYFSKAGNGICHQVHLERFGVPGKTLIGSDSHTPTCGGLGMLAIGAGGLDVAVAMAGGPFYLAMPEVVRIDLKGKLRKGVSAKDIILKVLSLLTTKGNVGKVIEYAGSALKDLTVPERATITNMGAELGVTTSIFPSDEQTKRFLDAQGRGRCWRRLESDPGAAYAAILEIDLSTLNPMVALPHSPDNVKELREIQGIKVQQVAIGSCTNSSYQDLMTVASILDGRSVHPETSLIIAPGSRQVFQMVERDGGIRKMIQAGARLMEFACGFCIGNGQSPCSAGVSARTNNRNFKGRSGTDDAQVYLVSPESAAVAAIKGEFADPLQSGIRFSKPKMPSKFLIDDSMVIPPSGEPEKVVIKRGPNIGEPPYSEPTRETYAGVVVLKAGDKVTTDDIMPAGQRLKYRSNIPKYAEFVFEKMKPGFAKICLENKAQKLVNIIVAGESYGQGSSREHAAICPMYLGVKFVLAKSMERIHKTNLVNFGVVPLLFKDPSDYEGISESDRFDKIDGLLQALKDQEEIVLKNSTKGTSIVCRIELSRRSREMLIAGGLLNSLAHSK
jgi:aconitate hydratase